MRPRSRCRQPDGDGPQRSATRRRRQARIMSDNANIAHLVAWLKNLADGPDFKRRGHVPLTTVHCPLKTQKEPLQWTTQRATRPRAGAAFSIARPMNWPSQADGTFNSLQIGREEPRGSIASQPRWVATSLDDSSRPGPGRVRP